MPPNNIIRSIFIGLYDLQGYDANRIILLYGDKCMSYSWKSSHSDKEGKIGFKYIFHVLSLDMAHEKSV
jgi:hypothetical protein